MTYLRDGVEYLTWDEHRVCVAVAALVEAGRTANTSQVARAAQLSRTMTSELTGTLRRRGYLRDAGKGNAHHWRLTDKPRSPEGVAR